MRVVAFPQEIISQWWDVLQRMQDYIHIVISLHREVKVHSHLRLTTVTLMLLSPIIPGRYLVPSNANEYLEVWSRACTASDVNTGCNTNYTHLSLNLDLCTLTLPTFMSSKDGSMIW